MKLSLTVHRQPIIPIKLLDPTTAHCYLGDYITTNGNYKTEINTFKQLNQQYVQMMHNCPFSQQCKAYVVYWQCYLPTVGYPLTATLMPPAQLDKLQSPATSIFLTKLGYPQLFPHAITYASMDPVA